MTREIDALLARVDDPALRRDLDVQFDRPASEPGIYGFALEGQHAEHALVGSEEVFSRKAVECLYAEGELANGRDPNSTHTKAHTAAGSGDIGHQPSHLRSVPEHDGETQRCLRGIGPHCRTRQGSVRPGQRSPTS